MVNKQVKIPKFRALSKDTGKYVIGYLYDETLNYKQGDSETQDQYSSKEKEYYIMSNNGHNVDLIDEGTLAINFPDMLDSNDVEIFAALNDNGIGGDVDASFENFEGIIEFIYESQETIPYWSSWSSYTVTEIKEKICV